MGPRHPAEPGLPGEERHRDGVLDRDAQRVRRRERVARVDELHLADRALVASRIAVYRAAQIATARIATDTEPLAYAQAASQEQVIAAVEKRYNAKVVRVTETTVAGRPALRLRLLLARRVWNVVVDAATGQELAGG